MTSLLQSGVATGVLKVLAKVAPLLGKASRGVTVAASVFTLEAAYERRRRSLRRTLAFMTPSDFLDILM